mmetsp:Transcript_12327/g.21366  ORF Transcript_12327/g.21366 Transcript_12327/m.21366 type:complete len:157 (+) Transcript_12327:102-572(+)
MATALLSGLNESSTSLPISANIISVPVLPPSTCLASFSSPAISLITRRHLQASRPCFPQQPKLPAAFTASSFMVPSPHLILHCSPFSCLPVIYIAASISGLQQVISPSMCRIGPALPPPSLCFKLRPPPFSVCFVSSVPPFFFTAMFLFGGTCREV